MTTDREVKSHTREELLEEEEEAREAKLHAAAQARRAAIEKGNAETRAAMKSLAMANFAKEAVVSNDPGTELENGQQQGASPMTEAVSIKTEIGPNGGAPPVGDPTNKPKPKLAPMTVGNPAAASSMAIDQQHMEEFASAEESPSTIECQRPSKGHFFTVRPETSNPWRDRAFYYLLQLEGRDSLIVAPNIAKQKKEEDTIRPVLLVRYVTMAGEEGLWPVKLDQQDGKSNRWNRSALNILELASSGKWVRIVSTKKEYRYQVSRRTLEETPPRFTDRDFKELVDEAFKGRLVDSLDHEIWAILEDGSDK